MKTAEKLSTTAAIAVGEDTVRKRPYFSDHYRIINIFLKLVRVLTAT